MLDLQVSRARREPLYRQLADGLAYAIATGRLEAGATLPSLREAEAHWGVNLHTVRRAYAEVEQAGLVRTVPRSGTIVLAESERAAAPAPEPGGVAPGERDAFVRGCLAEAERRFGLTPTGFAERLLVLEASEPPEVRVAECSRSLASMLAEQLRTRWRVRAEACRLDELPPAGVVVSTYFHYNELRDALEERISDLSFVRIRPSESFFQEMERAVGGEAHGRRVVLLETDGSLAHNVGADLVRRFGAGLRIEIRVTGRAETAGEVVGIDPGDAAGAVVVVSPQNWDRLDEATRARPNVLPLRYEIETTDLERLGPARSWRPSSGVGR